ncbi:MAG: DUF2283 domain-containing protein [Endomicrobiia bacterium]
MIQINYDKEGDILEIKFSEVPIQESEYLKKSGIVIDYDNEGKIVAIEVLSYSKRVKKETLPELAAI